MPQIKNNNKLYQCFVCKSTISGNDLSYNRQVLLPVCDCCKGSDEELNKAKELLGDLAEGFVCGCI